MVLNFIMKRGIIILSLLFFSCEDNGSEPSPCLSGNYDCLGACDGDAVEDACGMCDGDISDSNDCVYYSDVEAIFSSYSCYDCHSGSTEFGGFTIN